MSDQDLYYFNKVKFEHIFQDLESTKINRLPWGWAAMLLPSLFLPFITAENYTAPVDRKSYKFWIFWGAVLIGVLWLIVVFIRHKHKIKTGKWYGYDLKTIKNKIIESNILLPERYAIVLIVPIIKEDGINFLAAKHQKWDDAISLPYFNCEKKVFDNFTNVIEEEINPKFTTIKTDHKYLDYMSIFDEKKLYQSEQRVSKCNYKFALIYPRSNFLLKRFLNDFERCEYGFKECSVDEMMQDIPTIRRNYEIIDKLKAQQNQIKIDYLALNRKKNKLVWNICERCDKKCGFCVYGDERTKSTQKIDISKMIHKLAVLKIDVIDISTGDSIDIEYLKDAIEKIKNAKYSINLSATANVLSELGNEFLANHISTIKFSYTSSDNKMYKDNYDFISNLKNHLKNRGTVNYRALVVLDKELTKSIFYETIQKLSNIGVKDITLLRMMPIDQMMIDNYQKDISDTIDFLDYFTKNKEIENVNVHCAFGEFNSSKKSCNQGITKLGMSPNGNLYACPWDEYLKSKSDRFKIGNIIIDNDVVEKLDQFCTKLDKSPSCCSALKEINGTDHLS
ncbi:hypothetical protein FACS189494_03220 [Spirochaetia bacterium]|nr:hypothetical protein FACS189494_03220 [Spirochaetia bacterium]